MLNSSRKHKQLPIPFRPRLEILEDRTLLSVCTVDRLTDTGEGKGDMGDLRYCITNAADGDTITFGVTGTINLTGVLPDLTHNISIEGPGSDLMTVRRNTGGNYRIFTVATGVTASITGLTITNGNGIGGGVWSNGILTVTNSSISGNYGNPGGIANGGTLTVSNSTISGNHTNDIFPGGGGILNYGQLTVSNSTISGNTALSGSSTSGGGIYQDFAGTLIITNSTISNNTARNGGGISQLRGTIIANNCTISGNSADYGGGG
ncbi:MAG TPA: right-handed parallel beta-helix repeat-containing protein, partial [Gemmataceae bacterium]|nr:right-handed parallel beta-helix repeat-containing protein [Gemmataceae bacterium]